MREGEGAGTCQFVCIRRLAGRRVGGRVAEGGRRRAVRGFEHVSRWGFRVA